MNGEFSYTYFDSSDRHAGTQHLLRYFTWIHLPKHLQPISQRLANTAAEMAEQLEDGPELTAGLRKLLEAKDCFVRAMVTQTDTKP